MAGDSSFRAALEAHDAAVAARGLAIWIGGEPTFTDRRSTEPTWNGAALGADKRERGGRAAAALLARHPGALLLCTAGKQYPGEDRPRWSYGVYARRDGAALWRGPADPLAGGAPGDLDDARRLRDALAARLSGACLDRDGAQPFRVVCGAFEPDDEALARPPLDSVAVPEHGPRDELAERAIALYTVGVDRGAVRLDLPAIAEVAELAAILDHIAGAADDAGVTGLALGGFPPPVDHTIWWTTVTPDPGVLEINGAPEAAVAAYYDQLAAIHEIARDVGLEPEKLYFNGDLAESGGGGHITFGGPSAEASPFFRQPMLLARLLAYANRHPALSYLFAPDCVGSSSQSPRPDEVARESFEELAVAVDVFRRVPDPSPADVWSALAPFLADRFGNAHRIEINVEKLWNPFLPLRGRLGVVEMRAMRMQRNPERGAAVAALVRAVLAHLATSEPDLAFVDWGAQLHDRFALPHFQCADLDEVLADLEGAGLGLGGPIASALRDVSDLDCGRLELGDGARLTVRWAREFWPIVGDGSHPEHTSRLMDASCARLELTVTGADAEPPLAVAGRSVPWARDGDTLIRAVRFRRFTPSFGLHPHVAPLDPLVIEVAGHTAAIHGWSPDGAAYDGHPRDRAEAARRRAARFVTSRAAAPGPRPPAPPASLTRFTVDTRRFPGVG